MRVHAPGGGRAEDLLLLRWLWPLLIAIATFVGLSTLPVHSSIIYIATAAAFGLVAIRSDRTHVRDRSNAAVRGGSMGPFARQLASFMGSPWDHDVIDWRVFDQLLDCVQILDAQGRVLAVNRRSLA